MKQEQTWQTRTGNTQEDIHSVRKQLGLDFSEQIARKASKTGQLVPEREVLFELGQAELALALLAFAAKRGLQDDKYLGAPSASTIADILMNDDYGIKALMGWDFAAISGLINAVEIRYGQYVGKPYRAPT